MFVRASSFFCCSGEWKQKDIVINDKKYKTVLKIVNIVIDF